MKLFTVSVSLPSFSSSSVFASYDFQQRGVGFWMCFTGLGRVRSASVSAMALFCIALGGVQAPVHLVRISRISHLEEDTRSIFTL